MHLDDLTIRTLLTDLRVRGRDRLDVEVKTSSGGVPNLADTLCAFGNLPGGGLIVLGLDERRDFAATGVSNPSALMAAIASQARNAVEPPVQVDFEEVMIDGTLTLFVQVREVATFSKPCRVRGVAYLRQADGDYALSEAEVAQFIAARERPRFDVAPVEAATTDDLNESVMMSFVVAARRSSSRLAEQSPLTVLRRKAAITNDDVPTVAGLYALGEYPQQFAPSLAITAAVRGRDIERTRDLVHFDGPLPELLDKALEWVRRNTRSEVRFGVDGHGRDYDELPLVAVRELIANALVHRDLSSHTSGKRVEIRLTDDHLVISNPGGLWGLRVGQLGRPGGKAAVNEHLYEVCKLVRTADGNRVIEGEGGGIRAVLDALEAASLPQPVFQDTGVMFTVLVPRHALMPAGDLAWLAEVASGHDLDATQSSVLVGMRHGHRWTNPEVRRRFGLGAVEARSALQGLVRVGLAQAIGRGRGTAYEISPQIGGPVLPPVNDVRIVTPVLDGDPVHGQERLPFEATAGREATSPAMTKNGPAIWTAMGEKGAALAELVESTGLTAAQVRFALAKLRDLALIETDGGWGVHSTTYHRATDGTLCP